MFSLKNYLLPALLGVTLLTACKKDAGFGGQATIKGKVYVKDFDKSGYLKSEGYAGDIRVTIGVAGAAYELDDQRTLHDGSFAFRFLRKGHYEIWVYEKCDTCVLEQRPVLQEVHITGKKQNITLPDFVIAQ